MSLALRISITLLIIGGIQIVAFSQEDEQKIDPKTILYSVPTLSNELPKLVANKTPPSDKDSSFHEDDWAQIEFLPKSQLDEVKRMLSELKEFESSNRTPNGWKQVYIRKLDRKPIFHGDLAINDIEKTTGTKLGKSPVILSVNGAEIVTNGFTIPLGGNINLYGYTSGPDIMVLGADLGKDPDSQVLTSVFSKINSFNGSILVDWKSQMILVTTTPTGQLEVWRP